MNTNSNNSMETVLKEIIRLRGLTVLADGRVLTSMYCDLSNEKKDQRLLRYFVESGGHTALLDAQNLSPSMQKARFNQTVNKMCTETLVSEEVARQVCNAFWSVVYGRPMEETPVFPQEVKQETIHQEHTAQQFRELQRETAKQIPLKAEASERKFSYFDKPEYYISQEEAEKGGEIPVYYKRDKLYITIPPHTPDKYEVRPVSKVRVVDAEKCRFNERERRFNERNESYYSDALIQAYVNHGWTKRVRESISNTLLAVAVMYTATVVLGGVACLLSYWEDLPAIMLDFSSIKNALRSIFSIAYWMWPLLVVVKGDLLGDVRESLNLKKELQIEIERRKTLPLRK